MDDIHMTTMPMTLATTARRVSNSLYLAMLQASCMGKSIFLSIECNVWTAAEAPVDRRTALVHLMESPLFFSALRELQSLPCEL